MHTALADLARLATAPHATATRAVTAPFTGAVLGQVPEGTAACVERAVAVAREAQPAWAAVPVRARCHVAWRLHDLVLEHREAILDVMQMEGGKARRDALEEVLDVVLVARYYATRAPGWLAPRRRRGALPLLTKTTELRVPLGVVGVIAPWNYPLTIALTDALPALLAGNAVVLKPAETTPFTALFALALLRAAGLPHGVMHVVPGAGETAGAALAETADAVQFTGSTDVGRLVAAVAGRRLVPASMELGGKNAALVLADADLDAAALGVARACFTNAGQLCVSAERVLVDARVYQGFRDRLAARTRALRLAADFSLATEVGSLASAQGLEKTRAHVDDAVALGARVLVGGTARPDIGPLFYAPTLLEGVRPGMRAWDEETFGPVAALAPFETEDQAIALANATDYGLNASVWTRDAARGERIAARLRCGTVGVNDPYGAAWASVDAPMGGMKASGLGRRHGEAGLLKFTDAQTVAVQRGRPLAPTDTEDAAVYFDRLTRALSFVRHVPGLR